MMESIDYDHPFEQGTSDVVECLPCEDQTGIEAETIEIDRVIIEWCCGNNSRLGRPSRYSQGCRVVRLTIDDDLRALDGLHKALNIVNNARLTEFCYGVQCHALEEALFRNPIDHGGSEPRSSTRVGEISTPYGEILKSLPKKSSV